MENTLKKMMKHLCPGFLLREYQTRKKLMKNLLREVNRISAACQFLALQGQCVEWKDAEIYQYMKKVHALLALHDICDLQGGGFCRIGNEHDGGYVMVYPFSRKKIAYSIGISNDVSWDKQMAQRGYEIYQYDHTIKHLPEKNPSFHWKRIGLAGSDEKENMLSLSSMLRDNGHASEDGMVLKVDVEGCEWDVLESIDADTLNQFDQIIIELHYIDRFNNSGKILRCLEKLTKSHAAIHIHGNNYDGIIFCGDLITPVTLEVTLVKKELYTFTKSKILLPRLLDSPNIPDLADIWIGNWNIEICKNNDEKVIGGHLDK